VSTVIFERFVLANSTIIENQERKKKKWKTLKKINEGVKWDAVPNRIDVDHHNNNFQFTISESKSPIIHKNKR
jgi:hypothetical protein